MLAAADQRVLAADKVVDGSAERGQSADRGRRVGWQTRRLRSRANLEDKNTVILPGSQH